MNNMIANRIPPSKQQNFWTSDQEWNISNVNVRIYKYFLDLMSASFILKA